MNVIIEMSQLCCKSVTHDHRDLMSYCYCGADSITADTISGDELSDSYQASAIAPAQF